MDGANLVSLNDGYYDNVDPVCLRGRVFQHENEVFGTLPMVNSAVSNVTYLW